MENTKVKIGKRKLSNEAKLVNQSSDGLNDRNDLLSTSLASNGSKVSFSDEYDLDTSDEEVIKIFFDEFDELVKLNKKGPKKYNRKCTFKMV